MLKVNLIFKQNLIILLFLLLIKVDKLFHGLLLVKWDLEDQKRTLLMLLKWQLKIVLNQLLMQDLEE